MHEQKQIADCETRINMEALVRIRVIYQFKVKPVLLDIPKTEHDFGKCDLLVAFYEVLMRSMTKLTNRSPLTNAAVSEASQILTIGNPEPART